MTLIQDLPRLFLQRMESVLGKEAYSLFLASYTAPPITSIRINPLKLLPTLVQLNDHVPWCAEGRYVNPSIWSGHHPYHHAGAFYFQEASAMAVVDMMDIQPNDAVLDIAAAPGGKTTQIGSRLGPKGLLIANDVDSKRAQALMFNVERMGLTQVVVTNHDPDHLSQILPMMFDKVLIDAPCSGEGMFRKDAEAVSDWSIEHIKMCSHRQQQLLSSSVKLLKPGGKLIYSTCTFAPEENEQLIQQWLKHHPEFIVVDHPLQHQFDRQTTQGFGVKLWPHQIRGDGHYIVVLQHQGNAKPSVPYQHRMKNPPSKIWQRFAAEHFHQPTLNPNFMLEDRLFLIPTRFAYQSALHMLRAGVYLGEIKNNLFYPSHHLAHTLDPKDVKRVMNFSLQDPLLKTYMKGEEIPSSLEDGWVLICVDGLGLGWGKISQGRVKNHYPKGLRLSQFLV
jgi:NOL1/NOP2/sun family putative RNA methylase